MATKIIEQGMGIQDVPDTMAIASLSSIDLAVATTGSDAPTATRPKRVVQGSYIAEPYLTIQAALDALPTILAHDCEIAIAAGSYSGFKAYGFTVRDDARLDISGLFSLVAFTPATGPATTSFQSIPGRNTGVVPAAGWTPGDLVGRVLTVGFNEHPIIQNTATQIWYLDANNGQVAPFTSFDIKARPVEVTGTIRIEDFGGECNIDYIHAPNSTFVSDRARNGRFFKCTGAGFRATRGVRTQVSQCICNSFLNADDMQRMDIKAVGISVGGVRMTNVGRLAMDGLHSVGHLEATPDTAAVRLEGVRFAQIRSDNPDGIIIENGQHHGLELLNSRLQDDPVSAVPTRPFEIKGCGTDGIRMSQGSLILRGALDGSGNGGFGIKGDGPFNAVELPAALNPTITGALGDFTVDGTIGGLWNSDFPVSTPNSFVHVGSGARIFRR